MTEEHLAFCKAFDPNSGSSFMPDLTLTTNELWEVFSSADKDGDGCVSSWLSN